MRTWSSAPRQSGNIIQIEGSEIRQVNHEEVFRMWFIFSAIKRPPSNKRFWPKLLIRARALVRGNTVYYVYRLR